MVVAREKGKRAQSSLEWASPEEDKVALKSEERQPELSSSDWASGLPEGILDSILDRVIQLSDYLRFAAICKPWFSAVAHQKDRRRREPYKQAVPFLLIAAPNQSPDVRAAEDNWRRRLYSVTQRKVLNKELRVPYPRRCCGSSHGWLANVEMDCFSRILSLDVSQPEIKELAPRTSVRLEKSYIVESSSGADLLLVARFRKHNRALNCMMTSSFKIFKLLGLGSSIGDSGNDQQMIEKVEITSLGDDTLFLGNNCSQCVSASHFPGCQANCIYYTDDYQDTASKPQDTGIYFLEKRAFARHFQMNTRKLKILPIPPLPPPIWIVPTML